MGTPKPSRFLQRRNNARLNSGDITSNEWKQSGAFKLVGGEELGLDSFNRVPDVDQARMHEEVLRRKAHENARVARLVMGLLAGGLGLLAMLLSFIPTHYNWDPDMPSYTDVNKVSIATAAASFASAFTVTAIAFLWRSRVAVALLSLLLAVGLYRFLALIPHN